MKLKYKTTELKPIAQTSFRLIGKIKEWEVMYALM